MKNLLVGLALAALALSFRASPAAGEPVNLLPNPSFEMGDGGPYGWSLFGAGEWTAIPGGGHCVTVSGEGGDESSWRVDSLHLRPGGLYRIAYRVRRLPGAQGGTTIAGLASVNHDLRAGYQWQSEEFFFRAPDHLREDTFRVGQWHVKGGVQFDDISLMPAVAVHHRTNVLDLPLGEGESIHQRRYTASHHLGGPNSNYCRFLAFSDASFNTNRWVFTGGKSVTYYHRLGRLLQDQAEVEVSLNYHVRGTLVVEASGDHRQWLPIGRLGEVAREVFPLPSQLLPARSVWVRLRAEGDSEFQVDGYEYRCFLPEADPAWEADGETHCLAVSRTSPELEVTVEDISTLAGLVRLTLASRGARGQAVVTIFVEDSEGRASSAQERTVLTPHSVRRLTLPLRAPSPGRQTLRITCARPSDPDWGWEAEGSFMVSPLDDPRGGEVLSQGPRLTVWWCEPERKVSRTRPVPSAAGPALQISAAGNEYEAAQLVLTPASSLPDCRITVSDLAGAAGARLPSSRIEVRQVAYVNIQKPSTRTATIPSGLRSTSRPAPRPATTGAGSPSPPGISSRRSPSRSTCGDSTCPRRPMSAAGSGSAGPPSSAITTWRRTRRSHRSTGATCGTSRLTASPPTPSAAASQ